VNDEVGRKGQSSVCELKACYGEGGPKKAGSFCCRMKGEGGALASFFRGGVRGRVCKNGDRSPVSNNEDNKNHRNGMFSGQSLVVRKRKKEAKRSWG